MFAGGLALAAVVMYLAGGAAGQQEDNAARQAAPIIKHLNDRPPQPPNPAIHVQ
jgi:hypothetical protein